MLINIVFCLGADQVRPSQNNGIFTRLPRHIQKIMTKTGQRSSSRLEVLIGLAIFDPAQTGSGEIRTYRQFGKRQSSAAGISGGTGRRADAQRLREWYDAFMPEGIRESAARMAALLRLAAIIVGGIAFFTGLGAAGYLFRYDGTVPVNVLPVLVFFALLPLLMLLASALSGLLLRSGTGRIPVFFWWMEWPFRTLLRKADRDLPEGMRRNLSETWLVHSTPAGHYFRRNLQLAGVAYIFGALLWVLFHVATTDLAFAWSSTLEMRGETLYSITNVISAPWRDLVPAAVVDAGTVEATRFYRADGSGFRAVSSGRWWPFIFMSMMVYGFLPRVLAYFCYHWRFRKTVDAAMVASDSGREILGFMEESLISVSSDDRNRAVTPAGPDPDRQIRASGTCVVLLWGLDDIGQSEVRAVLHRKVLSVGSLSGLHSVTGDRKSISQAARVSFENEQCDILIMVPLWEPPRLHFEKKLEMLIQEAVKSRIIILPVADEQERNSGTGEVTWHKRVDEINVKHGGKRVYFDSRNVIEIGKLSGSQ